MRAESNFFPTVDDLRPHLGYARLILLNSPLNPTGTAIDPEVLRTICEAIVEENRRRERAGAKAVWLCYDQVYWQLAFGGAKHVTPPEVCPDVAPYTIILDAASKSFAATGLRVGWAVMPPAARQRMADILGHVGAWAPRPSRWRWPRCSTTAPPSTPTSARCAPRVQQRLDRLAAGFAAMRQARAAGRGDRAARGDLSLRPVRASPAGRTRRPAGCCSTAPAWRWCRFRPSGCARRAAGSGSRSVPSLSRRSTPRCRGFARRSPRATSASCRARRCPSSPLRSPSCCASACSRSPRTSTATRRCARSSPSGSCSTPPAPPIPRTYCQFGPLHTTLMRPFIALDHYAPRSSRYLSLLCGLLVFFPFFAFARRLVGEARAGWRPSRWPSRRSTCRRRRPPRARRSISCCGSRRSSGCWRRSNRGEPGTFAVAGLLASLAAVTRYDAWLALPMVALAAWPGSRARREPASAIARAWPSSRSRPRASRSPGSPGARRPAAIRSSSPTTSPATTRSLAATAAARYGALGGRARQLGVWSLAFLAAMTPPCAVLAGRGAAPAARARCRRRCAWSSSPRWGRRRSTSPRGCVAQSFEPLARFALVPGALLLPLAAAAVPLERAARLSLAARSPRPPDFPWPCGWSPPSGASGSGRAPNRWGRSPGSTARTARWPPTCAPSASRASG